MRTLIVWGYLWGIGTCCVLFPTTVYAQETPQHPWYQYHGDGFSAGFVGGVLLDATGYRQDHESRQQVGDLRGEYEKGEVRAIRLGVIGQIKFAQPWNYVFAGAYRAFDQGFNTNTDAVFTIFDLAVSVPLGRVGRMTVGKMKEPISLERLMSLAFEQFMERPVALDALFPARNVGITLGNAAWNERMTWRVGWFNPWLDQGTSFKNNSNQFIGRVTGLVYQGTDGNDAVHLGAGFRYSDTRLGIVRFQSTPEAFFAPKFVDTEDIPAGGTSWYSLEASWLRGPLWVASEGTYTSVNSSQYQDPQFWGAHVSAGWLLTGESRGYRANRAVAGRVIPKQNVNAGGLGAWELVGRYSRVDLTDGLANGGELDRISGGINWYPTKDSRLTFQYGFITLDRSGLTGHTHAFQLRWQLLMD